MAKITNFIALSLLLLCSYALSINMKFFSKQQNCFTPDPNTYKFQDDWKLNNGSGEISFKGKGRDVYIKMNNQNNNSSFQYWIVINGWDNTKSRITRQDDSEVCFVNVAAVDLNNYSDYKILLNKAQAKITVMINGKESFSCVDSKGWNAPDAKFFSVSRFSGANFEFCGLSAKDLCWIPDPNAYRLDNDWKLNNGAGIITFRGKGRDVYIRLNNQNNTNSFQYWIVINGWGNTKSRITRQDDSEVCFVNVAALDLNKEYEFKTIIDPGVNVIRVLIDGIESFSCSDDKGFNASAAQNFSISRWGGANFQICGNVTSRPLEEQCFEPASSSYKFQDDWRLNNGNGEINFKGKGRDLYVQVNNQNNSNSHQYWIVINGWDNTNSRITRGNGTMVCMPSVPALDLNKQYNYKVKFDSVNKKISVFIDGKESFSCVDDKGWNATAAQYYSFSRCDCAHFQVCTPKN
jgi:hypothetical protein